MLALNTQQNNSNTEQSDSGINTNSNVKDSLTDKTFSGFPAVYDTAANKYYAWDSPEGQKKNKDYLKNLQPTAVTISSQNELEKIYCPEGEDRTRWYWTPWEVPIRISLLPDWCFYFTYGYSAGTNILSRGERGLSAQDQRGWMLVRKSQTPGVLTSLGKSLPQTQASPLSPEEQAKQLTDKEKGEILSKIKKEFVPESTVYPVSNNFMASDWAKCEVETERMEKWSPNREVTYGISSTLSYNNTDSQSSLQGATTRVKGILPCGVWQTIHEYLPFIYNWSNTQVSSPQVNLFNVGITVSSITAPAIPHREASKEYPHAANQGNHNHWVRGFDKGILRPMKDTDPPLPRVQVFNTWVQQEAPHVGYIRTGNWNIAGADAAYVFDRYVKCVPPPANAPKRIEEWLPKIEDEQLRSWVSNKVARCNEQGPKTQEDEGTTYWVNSGAKVYMAVKGALLYQIHTDSDKLFFEQCWRSPFKSPTSEESAHQCHIASVPGADNIIYQAFVNEGKLSEKLLKKLEEWDEVHREETQLVIKEFEFISTCSRPGGNPTPQNGLCVGAGDFYKGTPY